MGRVNVFSAIAEMVGAGARRMIASLAREQVEIEEGLRDAPKQKPITRAVARLRNFFADRLEGNATYEDYRNIYRQQLRAAKSAYRESERQQAQIDAGIPPTPPRATPRSPPNRYYVMKVEMINPRTGVSYWSTVYYNGPEGLTLTELTNAAAETVLTNNRDSRGFQRAKVNNRWDVAKVEWIG